MSDFRHRAEPVVKRSRSIHMGQVRKRMIQGNAGQFQAG